MWLQLCSKTGQNNFFNILNTYYNKRNIIIHWYNMYITLKNKICSYKNSLKKKKHGQDSFIYTVI
jgi:hypothetical protein